MTPFVSTTFIHKCIYYDNVRSARAISINAISDSEPAVTFRIRSSSWQLKNFVRFFLWPKVMSVSNVCLWRHKSLPHCGLSSLCCCCCQVLISKQSPVDRDHVLFMCLPYVNGGVLFWVCNRCAMGQHFLVKFGMLL